MARLRRFLPEQVADLIVAAGNGDALLQSHRREVTVVFCDLRGFTAFAETAEPEEVMAVLGEYHSCLGEQIVRHGGTLERFVGDGIVVVFNDPLPCADHTERAVSMAAAMRDAIDEHSERWRKRDYLLGFGIGIARGHATIGRIGFDQRCGLCGHRHCVEPCGSIVRGGQVSADSRQPTGLRRRRITGRIRSCWRTDPEGLSPPDAGLRNRSVA